MKIASVADGKAYFSAYMKETEAGPVMITRNGATCGAPSQSC